jgi:uncharacterized membrane protein
MPFLIATVILVSSRDAVLFRGPVAAQLALAFGFIAEVLALVIGFFARTRISGQIGMVGAITVFVLIFVMVAGVAVGLFMVIHESAVDLRGTVDERDLGNTASGWPGKALVYLAGITDRLCLGGLALDCYLGCP